MPTIAMVVIAQLLILPQPTLSHYFIHLLAKKGFLLRNFTQASFRPIHPSPPPSKLAGFYQLDLIALCMGIYSMGLI